MNSVKISYYGHSCFTLEYEGTKIVLDPYADGSVPGLDPLRLSANACYCSHSHSDHGYSGAVSLLPGEQNYALSELLVPHDEKDGALRGMNMIRRFTFGTLSVVHFGDLGRELNEKEIAALSGADCVLIPVGGYYTIDAAQAKAIVGQIHPRVVIPMHYRTENSGYDVIAKLDAFTDLFDSVERTGSEYLLRENETEKVLVMEAGRKGGAYGNL